MTIWMYWENRRGTTKPAYLDLCLKTIRNRCGSEYEIILTDERTIRDYLPDMRPEIEKFPCICAKSEYMRTQLVYKYGGFWFDSDMIALKSIKEVELKLEESGSDFIGCGRSGQRPSSGFFGGKKGSKLIEKWIEAQDKAVSESKDYKFKWAFLAYGCLWPLSATYAYHHYPFVKCIPYYSHWKEIFFCTDSEMKDKYRKKITDDTLTVYLYNAMFPAWFKNMSEKQILDSNYYIADLLRENI